jgi:hypothetical protein
MTKGNLERSERENGEEANAGGGGIIAEQARPTAFRETRKVRGRELRRAKTTSPPLPAHLERLADRASDYFEAASAANTRRVYASDWKQFAGWCRSQGLEALPPSPQTVGLYITACASGAADGQPNSVTTIERRLSALTWHYAQCGMPLDRNDRDIATVLAGIRNTHAALPR